MFKIFISIFFSALLVGCNNKEVTEEMLIGNWQCKTMELKGNDPMMDYNSYQKYTITYFKDRKFGLTMSFNKGTPIPFKFQVKEHEEPMPGRVINESEYIYISDDIYNFIATNEIHRSWPEKSKLYSYSKTQCVRITN